MLSKEMLKEMEIEDLEELAQKIREEIEKRKRERKKEFEFYFEASADTRKRKNPYVARIYIKNGTIEREFKELERTYGKKEVTVYGHYTAKVGDVIEKREGGSWKNEYRYWYLILEDGSEKKVASIDDAKEKQRVIEYLKGQITMEELAK